MMPMEQGMYSNKMDKMKMRHTLPVMEPKKA